MFVDGNYGEVWSNEGVGRTDSDVEESTQQEKSFGGRAGRLSK